MKTNMMQLSKFLKWSVCGDGFVGYATNHKNCHYSISRSTKHKDYIDKIKSKLEVLEELKPVVSKFTRKDNNKEIIQLRTSPHPIMTRIRDRQYIYNHRVIDPHMLTLLDWESAAFLYMDDGSLCVNNKGSLITRLSTCAYSYAEQDSLRKAFIEKLGVIWNINRTGKNLYQLNLAEQSRDLWFKEISPFIVDSYKYKLPEFLQKVAPRTGGDLV